MTKVKHTRTPWAVSMRREGRWEIPYVGKPQTGPGFSIAKCLGITNSPGTNVANAEFIVRAVNSHEAMLDALDSIAKIAAPRSGTIDDIRRDFGAIRSAAARGIAAAKGGRP